MSSLITKSDVSSPTVRCPNCGQNVAWTPEEAFRPFCSERCKLIDLGEWATEGYAIPVDGCELEEDEDETALIHPDRTQLFE